MSDQDPTEYFWRIGQAFLKRKGITRGKILGFPCLRYMSEFVAAPEHRNGALIVKLPADRVAELVDQNKGERFAPAGRPFKEWLCVTQRDARFWKRLIDDAIDFAATKPG